MLPDKNQFLQCVEVLLSSEQHVSNSDTYATMAQMLYQVTNISVDDDLLAYEDATTESGLAISPGKAAKCLQEVIRTKTFLKGVHEAISERLSKGRELHILYAGTGPYGTILLPLLPLFQQHKIKVHCIDIHQINIDALKKVIHWLEIESCIADIDLADATQWRPEQHSIQTFDLIISETMNTFLQREPQVQIFANLCHFLKPDGSLIPQQIFTSVSLKQFTEQGEQEYKQDLLVLNLDSCLRISANNEVDFKHQVTLPESERLFTSALLNTEIQVYQSHYLGLGQSSLNIQYSRLGLAAAAGQVASFEYKLTSDPYWQIDFPNVFKQQDICSANVQGQLGLLYLARFWDKYRRVAANSQDAELLKTEFELDLKLAELLKLNLQVLMVKPIEFMSSYDAFELWVKAHVLDIEQADIARFNQQCADFYL